MVWEYVRLALFSSASKLICFDKYHLLMYRLFSFFCLFFTLLFSALGNAMDAEPRLDDAEQVDSLKSAAVIYVVKGTVVSNVDALQNARVVEIKQTHNRVVSKRKSITSPTNITVKKSLKKLFENKYVAPVYIIKNRPISEVFTDHHSQKNHFSVEFSKHIFKRIWLFVIQGYTMFFHTKLFFEWHIVFVSLFFLFFISRPPPYFLFFYAILFQEKIIKKNFYDEKTIKNFSVFHRRNIFQGKCTKL